MLGWSAAPQQRGTLSPTDNQVIRMQITKQLKGDTCPGLLGDGLAPS